MNRVVSLLIAGFVALMILSSTVFVVSQKQHAVLFSFGKIGDVISKPGLYFKLPPPFQNVVYLEKRVLTLDTPDAQRFITAEKQNIMVDSYVKWRIVNPKLYYVSFNGREENAVNRLTQVIKSALNAEITKRNVKAVISTERDDVMAGMQAKIVQDAKEVGIEIVDVRIKRVDYADEINASVYERMKAERVKAANELRSTGSAKSEELRAEADRARTEILAKAFNEAEQIKGAGDAEASKIYAEAFGKSPEFYKFYRSLEAYRATFKSHGDVMVVDSNSEFFKYFRSPGGAGAAAPAKK
jgi:membrane protease subunit HflC